jgi:hypothetical protein
MEEIKPDLQDIGWRGVYVIRVARDREKWGALANMLMGPSVA